MDPIWLKTPEEYLRIKSESRRHVLYPKMVQLIGSLPVRTVLDYGCGDGSIVKLIDANIEIGLFDISKKILSLAEKNLVGRRITVYQNTSDIPSSYFDCVIFSLVLMTIDNQEAIRNCFATMRRSMKKGGNLLIAMTHPCFRQYHFSTFHTEFAESKDFNYLHDGVKFRVYLNDSITHEVVTFEDYHWSLATTVNLLADAGFTITNAMELPDGLPEETKHNPWYPPYLVLLCK